MANCMIQYILARELAERVGGEVTIYGQSLPEWGIALPVFPEPDIEAAKGRLVLYGQNFNLDAIASAMRQGIVDLVLVRGWAMRLEYYRTPQHYAPLFAADRPPSYLAADDEVLLHVRAGDTISGWHPLYFPLPSSFYARVIAETGLRPVFIGELEDNSYIAMLRQRFPQAKFLPPADPVADFESLRHARHVGLSPSSFSWLASWISARAQTIHYPVCGLLMPHPVGPNLVPFDDPRYRFYTLPLPDMATRRLIGTEKLLSREVKVDRFDRAQLSDLVRKALLPRHLPARSRSYPGPCRDRQAGSTLDNRLLARVSGATSLAGATGNEGRGTGHAIHICEGRDAGIGRSRARRLPAGRYWPQDG